MNNTYKTNKTNWRRLGRSILFVALLLGVALPAQARDYVITWTNGGTTYYVGMNGNNIAVKTEFDITCVWTCRNGNNDANLGGTSYSLRNKNNTTYFLTTTCTETESGGWWTTYSYSWSALTVRNSANNIWRASDGTNGNIYAYWSTGSGWNARSRSASIRVVNGAWEMYDNNNDGSQNSQVTTTTPGASSPTTAEIGTLTVTPLTAELYQSENETFTASASVTVTNYSVPAHTKYTFTVGSTDYEYFYYNNTRYTSIDDFSTKTTTTQTPSYAWTKTGDDGSNASLSSTNAASTTVTHATQAAADKSVTLTVTASYSGAESKTANATVVLYGPMVAPAITRSGNSISIATANINATIYYTTNGSTPTASSTPYTGSFDLTTSPTTVKAIAIRDGHSSTVTTETFNMQLPMPVISLTGAVATVTAGTGSPDGTKLYYTTNGTTPTSSSTEITSGNTVTLTNPQTIKVIAIKSGYDNSEVAVAEYIVEGVNGGLVVLDDRENHSWSYYSDPDCPIHSLNPADVKITYYGYGTKTMTSSNTDQLPANSAFDQNVASTAVQVNKGEAGNKFVYYKTLENANDDGTGNYPYTMIPNPFQMRPTYNNDWRGFYAWRVKSLSSGLSIKVGNTTYTSSNVSSGIIIYAEQEVEFITANEYGDSVAFEALWAKAYLDDGTNHYSNSGNYRNAYERNFKKVTSLTTYNYPVTFSSINPDGSGTVATVTQSGAYTCSNDVKLENMTLGTGNTIAANSYNLAIGRGVANGNGNVATTVYGDASPGTVSTRFTLRVESGKYSSDFYLFYSSNNNTACVATYILGSDYDRAKNDNSKLNISGEVDMGGNGYYCSNANSRINTYILSGTIGAGADDKEVYMGFVNSGSACNTVRKLEIFGGLLQNGIAGGIEGGSVSTTNPNMTMRIRGGSINRRFYGAGTYSPAYGDKRIVVTGGTITTWISGGAYGKNNTEGNTQGDIYLYFGGRASQTNTDGIFGAGYGNYTTGDDKYTVYKSNVVFADEATTAGSVYGGGNNGYAKQDIQVYVAGGHVAGNVFGGANKARSEGAVAVTVTGGSVDGGVYGGSNQSGAISGQITVDVYGTDPAPAANAYAVGQVFGGGNVAAYTGTPVVTVHNDSSCNISIGEVYGGGNQASVTGTNVTIEAGNIIGDVYGGGRQANVGNNGTSVTVNGGIIRRVFGGNNISGTIAGGTASKIAVNVDKTSSCPMKIGQVFGGGNRAASQVGSITVGCTGDLVTPLADGQRYGYDQEGIGAVYGGANEANITGDITLNIVSGIVDSVFGGNNAGGVIDGDITVNINKNGSAPCANHWYVGYVFGGGNNAAYSQKTADHPEVNVSAGLVTNHVFGGGNGSGATVSGNPTVTLSGTAQVGGNVFGGGNAAAVSGNTSVKLQN